MLNAFWDAPPPATTTTLTNPHTVNSDTAVITLSLDARDFGKTNATTDISGLTWADYKMTWTGLGDDFNLNTLWDAGGVTVTKTTTNAATGKVLITITGLAPGTYEFTLQYTGDGAVIDHNTGLVEATPDDGTPTNVDTGASASFTVNMTQFGITAADLVALKMKDGSVAPGADASDKLEAWLTEWGYDLSVDGSQTNLTYTYSVTGSSITVSVVDNATTMAAIVIKDGIELLADGPVFNNIGKGTIEGFNIDEVYKMGYTKVTVTLNQTDLKKITGATTFSWNDYSVQLDSGDIINLGTTSAADLAELGITFNKTTGVLVVTGLTDDTEYTFTLYFKENTADELSWSFTDDTLDLADFNLGEEGDDNVFSTVDSITFKVEEDALLATFEKDVFSAADYEVWYMADENGTWVKATGASVSAANGVVTVTVGGLQMYTEYDVVIIERGALGALTTATVDQMEDADTPKVYGYAETLYSPFPQKLITNTKGTGYKGTITGVKRVSGAITQNSLAFTWTPAAKNASLSYINIDIYTSTKKTAMPIANLTIDYAAYLEALKAINENDGLSAEAKATAIAALNKDLGDFLSGSATDFVKVSFADGKFYIAVSELQSGTKYTFRVQAVDTTGKLSKQTSFSAKTKSYKAIKRAGVERGVGSATLNWTVLSGVTVDSYEIGVRVGGNWLYGDAARLYLVDMEGITLAKETPAKADLSFKLTGLAAQKYTIGVFAITNVAGKEAVPGVGNAPGTPAIPATELISTAAVFNVSPEKFTRPAITRDVVRGSGEATLTLKTAPKTGPAAGTGEKFVYEVGVFDKTTGLIYWDSEYIDYLENANILSKVKGIGQTAAAVEVGKEIAKITGLPTSGTTTIYVREVLLNAGGDAIAKSAMAKVNVKG